MRKGNPAPLGLMGFGLATILLNLHNIGLYHIGAMVLAMGLCYGGTAQLIAGIMAWKQEDTFGATAFISYGLFWYSLIVLMLLPEMGVARQDAAEAMVAYQILWGILTIIFWLGSLKSPFVAQSVFLLAAILFFLLAAAEITQSAMLRQIAGYEGVLCGAMAIYSAAAQVLNDIYAKDLLPLGRPLLSEKK